MWSSLFSRSKENNTTTPSPIDIRETEESEHTDIKDNTGEHREREHEYTSTRYSLDAD